MFSSVYKESRSLMLANKLDVLRCAKNHVRFCLQTNLMFSSVYKESRSLMLANQLDFRRCTKNHVRCCLQTNLMFFGVQRITFVDACKQTRCSSVYKESRSLLIANKVDDECVWKGGGGVMPFVVICKQR